MTLKRFLLQNLQVAFPDVSIDIDEKKNEKCKVIIFGYPTDIDFNPMDNSLSPSAKETYASSLLIQITKKITTFLGEFA
jgi:hypothetical protein